MSVLRVVWYWIVTITRPSTFSTVLSVPLGRRERVPVRRDTTLLDRPPLRLCSQGHEALGLVEGRISRALAGRVSNLVFMYTERSVLGRLPRHPDCLQRRKRMVKTDVKDGVHLICLEARARTTLATTLQHCLVSSPP